MSHESVGAGGGPEKNSTFRVLMQRNFAPYFLGNLLSSSGTWIQNLAQAVLIFRLTGSTFLVSLVTFAQFLGVVVLAPWTGSAADRFDRRRLLMLTQIAQAAVVVALAIVTYFDVVNAAWLVGAALTVGVAKAFSVPPQQALVPQLVSRQDLQSAVALNSITFNLGRAIGPLVGAAIIATLGFTWAFGINALSYMAMVVALLMVDVPEHEKPARGVRPKLLETVRLVRHDPRIGPLLVVVGLVAVAVDPVNNLTPAFSVEIYGRSDTYTGILTGAFGLGAVIGAALIVARARASFRGIAIAMAAVGAAIAAFGLSTEGTVGLVALFVAGMAFITSVSLATTVVQMEVAEQHRGRLMALWGVAFLGVRPVASLIDGSVATLVGLREAAILMAIPVLVGAVFLARRAAAFPHTEAYHRRS